MKRALVVKNVSREGPGLVGEVLERKGVLFDTADLSLGEPFPPVRGYGAVFVFGGPDSANDLTPKITGELERIREILALKIPYFGVCLGMQLLVKAAGGAVERNLVKEVGWRDPAGDYYRIELTPEGRADQLFDGLGGSLGIFQLHGETVRLAAGMACLATGRHCRNQVVKAGERAYGVQGHLELTEGMLGEWMAQDEMLSGLDGEYLLREFNRLRQEYGGNCGKVVTNFLEAAGLAPAEKR